MPYAAVHLTTTGQRRVAEVAVVQLDDAGVVEGEWSTPVDAVGSRAPSFGEIAGRLAALLAGRVVVSHDVRGVLAALQTEYTTLGYDVPLVWPASLCTKELGSTLGTDVPGTLAGACRHHYLLVDDAEGALGYARATAGLLRCYLPDREGFRPWRDALGLAATALWPTIPRL